MISFILTVLFILIVLLILSIIRWGKKRVKKVVQDTISDVKEVVGIDSLELANKNLKSAKDSMAELVASTEQLRRDLNSEQRKKQKLILVGKAAKIAGSIPDFEESCGLHTNCAQAIKAIEDDILANETLYENVLKQVTNQQIILNKAESAKARREMRRESNKLRLKIARDANLGEGIFNFKEDDICQEELEAIGHEKVASDLGINIIDKYEVNDADAKSEFEALCSG